MIDQKTYFNPFPGLRSFEENEEYLFFGREKQIDDLLDQLEQTHFLAVVGTSGSGKSSLVKSGLLPSLHTGFIRGIGKGWRIGVFRPGDNPIGNLASCLCSGEFIVEEDEGEKFNLQPIVESVLRRSDQGILNVVDQFLNKLPENILLVADQFEELFRFSKYEKTSHKGTRDAVLFINLLLAAIEDRKRRIYVVFTMRSDYIGNCTEFRGLPEVLNTGQYLIPRMTRNEIQLAITGPIAVSGAKISLQLVSILLNEVGDDLDQLPILQHALMRTYDYWSEHTNREVPITTEHYQSIGKMELALSYHADEAYNELTEKQKIICAGLFKALTETGTISGGVRKPTKLAELSELLAVDKNVLIPIINVFSKGGRSFLMPPFEVEINDDSVIDISHESLMRVWIRLVDWFKEDINSIETYLKLCKDAESYQEGRGSLLKNPELAIMLKWREKQEPTKDWGSRYDLSYARAINFLENSKVKFDQEVLKKSLAQKRKFKRNKLVIYFMSIALIICISVGAYAFLQKEKAEEQTIRAGRNEKLARNNEKRAKQNAKEARENERKAITARSEADAQKLKAEENEKEANLQKLKAEENEKEANLQKLKAEKLKGISDAIKMAFAAEKNLDLNKIDSAIVQSKKAHNLFITNGNEERQNQIYTALNRSLFEGKSRKDNFYNHINSIGISTIIRSKSSKEFISLDNSKKLVFFKLDDTNKIIPLNIDGFENIDLAIYSSNGNYIICTKKTSSVEGELLIYNEKNKQLIKRVPFSNHIKSLNSFQHLKQQFIAFKEKDNSFLLNLNTLENNQFQNIDENNFFTFSENGGYFISKEKNIALLYQVVFNQSLPKLNFIKKIKSPSNITTFQFSKDENKLAIGTSGGMVLIYNTNDLSEPIKILKHKNVKISDLDFVEMNNQNFIISASYDNTINLVNIENSKDFISLKGHKSWVKNIIVDRKNKILYSVSEDASFRYWYLDQNELVNQLKN